MKLNTIFIGILAALFMSLGTQVFAQKVFNDTMLVFNQKAGFEMEGVAEKGILMKGFSLQPQSRNSMRKIAAPVAKKIKIPRATRVSKGPITIKHNGACYTFGCQKGGTCTDCKLYWYDRNGDGKVQPRRELRCFCSPGKMCKIRVKKSKC